MTPFARPRLLADIGEREACLALETGPGCFEQVLRLAVAEHAGPADPAAALEHYLASLPPALAAAVGQAAVAVAKSTGGELPPAEPLQNRLRLETLLVVSGFTARAMALPHLADHGLRPVGGGTPRPQGVIGLIEPGAGLAVGGLVPAGEGWVVLEAEGGHGSLSPGDEREIALLRQVLAHQPQVSHAALLSEPGLVRVHGALAGVALPVDEILRRALAAEDPRCVETLEVFCGLLGSLAGNLALTLGATGGIYLGGSIVPRLGAAFDHSPFRARFEAKGGAAAYLRSIPSHVITAEHLPFTGLSALLAERLRTGQPGAGPSLLDQIRRRREGLPPAERRVADQVLAQPRTVLDDPVAEIARAAGVSQPTVIRFCRSLGCDGLPDFKRRLAAGLSGALPLAHAPVGDHDSPLELGSKVLGNTAGAVLALREQLNREALEQALALLAAAHRIEVFATGADALLAADAQLKFLRVGLAAGSQTDARLLPLAAAVLRPGDLAVFVCSGSRADELLAVADTARERGAGVLAITAGQNPLARRADVALIVDHAEDPATQLPMVSRILHLLVIDILAVGVARPGTGLTSHGR